MTDSAQGGDPGHGPPENWSEVDDAAGKVDDAKPDAIRSVAGDIEGASTGANSDSSELKKFAGQLREAWSQGQDAEEFAGFVDKLSTAGAKVSDSLDGASKALDNVANTLERVKEKVNEIKKEAKKDIDKADEKLTENINNIPNNDPDAAQARQNYRDDAKKEKEKIAREAKKDIDRQLEIAEEQISNAMAKLDTNVDGGYSGLEAPGATSPQGVSNNGAGGGSAGPATPISTGDPGGNGSGGGAGAGGGGGGGLGSSGGPPSTTPPGNVEDWIKEAIEILKENGVPVTEDNIDEIWTIIEHESGGDPNAINDWDSNADKGTPSKGLMQCIDPTFDAHKLPGHDDIYDPVDNIIAGVRYTFDRYGGFENHPGLASMASGGGYQGY